MRKKNRSIKNSRGPIYVQLEDTKIAKKELVRHSEMQTMIVQEVRKRAIAAIRSKSLRLPKTPLLMRFTVDIMLPKRE